MGYLRTCACALALLLLAGCAATAATGQPTGHVSGRFLMEGGPLGPGGQQPRERAISGRVTFTGAGGHDVTVRVGRSGAFSAQLPAGRYEVSGRSPSLVEVSDGSGLEPPCSPPLSVTVTAGHTATIAVTCIVP
jgi:hypothetical protein